MKLMRKGFTHDQLKGYPTLRCKSHRKGIGTLRNDNSVVSHEGFWNDVGFRFAKSKDNVIVKKEAGHYVLFNTNNLTGSDKNYLGSYYATIKLRREDNSIYLKISPKKYVLILFCIIELFFLAWIIYGLFHDIVSVIIVVVFSIIGAVKFAQGISKFKKFVYQFLEI